MSGYRLVMGKRTRRKRQGTRGAHHRGGIRFDSTSNKDVNETNSTHHSELKSRAVLQRIKHGDPRIRDGALSALATTLFASRCENDDDGIVDGSEANFACKKNDTVVTDELLRAIVERVTVDRDVPTARAAAGCLLNYASSSDRNCRRLLREVLHVDVTAALLDRTASVLRIYNACNCPMVEDVSTAALSSTPSKKTTKKKKKGKRGHSQQHADSDGIKKDRNRTNSAKGQRSLSEWQVTAQCLSVLCTLLESTEGASCATRLTTTTTTCQTSMLKQPLQSHVPPSLETIVHIMATAYVLLTQPPPHLLPHRRDFAETSAADNTRSGTATATAEWRDVLNSSLATSLDSSARILHGIFIEQEEEEEAGSEGGLTDSLLRMGVDVNVAPKGGSETTSMMDGEEEEETGNGICRGFVDLLSAVASDGQVPARARLHAAGTLCAARHHIVNSFDRATLSGIDSEDAGAGLEEVLQRAIELSVLPLLSSFVDGYDPRLTSAMAHRVNLARSAVEEERIDATTEGEVEKMVRDRNEPARHIARRLMTKDAKHEAKLKEKAMCDEVNSEHVGKYHNVSDGDHGEGKGGDDVPMMETDDDDGITSGTRGDPDHASDMTSGSAPRGEDEGQSSTGNHKERDAKGSYERAVDAWERSILPLKLALEVTANLSVGSGGSDSGSNGPVVVCQDGDDDIAMQEESEEKEEEGEGGEEFAERRPTRRDVDLFCSIARSGLPERILRLLRVLCDPLTPPPTSTHLSTGTIGGITIEDRPALASANTTAAAAVAVPDFSNTGIVALPHMVTSDIAELRSKCGACLGNLLSVLSYPPDPSSQCSWRMDAGGTVELWKSLLSSLTLSTADKTGDGGGSIAGAMAVLVCNLRRRTLLLPRLGEGDLSLLLRMTKPDTCSVGGRRTPKGNVPFPSCHDGVATATAEVRQNVIVCLNALCSESHSADVNDAVCVALLQCVRDDTSVSVAGEAMNALMDIYGDDDGGENGYKRNVFLARDVLEEFRGALDSFRHGIQKRKQERGRDGASFGIWDNVVIGQLEEIALNASRFVEYKEEQLACRKNE